MKTTEEHFKEIDIEHGKPNSKGVFTLGERLEIRGSLFKVKDISPYGIKLKFLKQLKNMESTMLQAQNDVEKGVHPKCCPNCGSPNAFFDHGNVEIEPFWGCDDCDWQHTAVEYAKQLF